MVTFGFADNCRSPHSVLQARPTCKGNPWNLDAVNVRCCKYNGHGADSFIGGPRKYLCQFRFNADAPTAGRVSSEPPEYSIVQDSIVVFCAV